MVTDSGGYYRGRKQFESGAGLCSTGRIPKDLMETAVARLIQKRPKSWSASGHLADLEISRNRQISDLEHTIRAQEEKIATAGQAGANLIATTQEASDATMRSILSKSLTQAIEQASTTKADANAVIAKCQQEIRRLRASTLDQRGLARVAEQVNVWDSLSVDERKELVPVNRQHPYR